MATMSARYTVIDGEVVAQERGGVRHQLVPDPLGSTVALYDNTGTKTDTFEYWPYGESSSRTGGTSLSFQYIGSFGYYQDNNTRNYVRARYLDKRKGRWFTEDPAMDGFNYAAYVDGNPISFIDFLGLYKYVSCNRNQITEIEKAMNSLCSSSKLSGFDECLKTNCSCRNYGDLILGGGNGFPEDCASDKCKNSNLTFTCTNAKNKYCDTKKKDKNGQPKVVCAAWNPNPFSQGANGNIFVCEGFWTKKCDPKGCYFAHEMIHGCGQVGHPSKCFNCVTDTFSQCNNSYGGTSN
jgi:RHS repeat-associated protein